MSQLENRHAGGPSKGERMAVISPLFTASIQLRVSAPASPSIKCLEREKGQLPYGLAQVCKDNAEISPATPKAK
ncbi:hypothetical protein [Fulvimarina pelagi]|uniref:hypothetical protein n=2 Tax=Fulvimarina pelagi TaxID=217511 RepID=UPI0002F50554|nr:hypothetical protein [Fulvimarina pelagi]